MRVVLIGAGNLATHLGTALKAAGHDIVQVYSRTMESAQVLATALACESTTDIRTLATDADVYVFSVKDTVLLQLIADVDTALKYRGRMVDEKVFLHTAGSMPMDSFKGHTQHYGVLYPMQTFSKSRVVDFCEIPCFIEASDDMAYTCINQLATSVSSRVFEMSSDKRKYLHLAAVWACNFVNHCYNVAAEVVGQHGIPFEVLLPLIDETARKVHDMMPDKAQTGPAVRFDENVILAQMKLMEQQPLQQQLYRLLSESIHEYSLTRQKIDKNKIEG